MSKERRKSLIASSLFDGIEDSRIRYVLAILQDEDADPNYLLHDRGIAPIHLAIGHESKTFALEATSVLLQYGANPNICSAEGMTPVHIASAWGRARILRLLLVNGGNPWLEDDEGKNAFHFAFEESHSAAMQILEDFRLKDNGKFEDWTELCDPNPKFTIALDKVLLYNREVLLSYQASVPFAARGRCSMATQTSPRETTLPPPPTEPPPPRSGPVAASTTALDRFNFVLSDIRNKVVSQVTLRKVAPRTLSRRTALFPAPLSFLDELRQRQVAGLRRATAQISPPLETRLVHDEVMVRVTPSPMPSGDESRGSEDEFESHLDRAFRHMEVDAAVTGEGLRSSDEWVESSIEGAVPANQGAVSANQGAVPDPTNEELRLDLRCLGRENNVDSTANNFVTVNGFHADNASLSASVTHDNIPYGKHDSSFGVNNTTFGTNYVTANASCNDSSVGINVDALNGTNDEIHDNRTSGRSLDNKSNKADRALISVIDSGSAVKSACFNAMDVRDECLISDLNEGSRLADGSCDMFEGTSYDLQAPTTEADDVGSPTMPSFLMVTARSQLSYNEKNSNTNNVSDREKAMFATEREAGNSQGEDSCKVVWEGAMDARESFSSCREFIVPTSNIAVHDPQQREDVVSRSFLSLPAEVSTEFISEDEESFDDRTEHATTERENVEQVADVNLGGAKSVPPASKPASAPTSWSSDSMVSASEEYVYTDEEEGVVLVERRFLVPPSDNSDDSTDQSLATELEGYDTDRLRRELRKQGVEPGPILASTKRVYLKKLQRLARGKMETDPDHKQVYSSELDRSLREETWSLDLTQYEALEQEMSAQFTSADPRKCWREGVLKSSFCYLLLDPRITANLPRRAATTTQAQAWATFLEAVFYVGKGKRSRPYSHLYQAVNVWKSGNGARDAKTQQILDIWAAGLGVVCLHVFQNVIPVEAYTREAAMLDALTLGRVRNARRTEYYGVAAAWPAKRRNMLGTLLLHKALKIFLGEGERQLRPGDIRQ